LSWISRRTFGRTMVGAATSGVGLPHSIRAMSLEKAMRTPSFTDVDGLLAGHYTLPGRPTGCTVVLSRQPFTAGVDVRGGAPGTRETDLLRADNTVDSIHAIFLSGGSAFGLDAGAGVMQFLEEQGVGFPVRGLRIPIVCGAVLYDLELGDSHIRPGKDAGYAAAKSASGDPVPEGNVGAGAGCTVGKLLGPEISMKAGLGSWSFRRKDGLVVAALAAVNAVGDIVDPEKGSILAGARGKDGIGFLDISKQLRQGSEPKLFGAANTVLGIIGTNAVLSKAQCARVAVMAQDALARCIRPSHTPWDGDTVFAIATGKWIGEGKPADPGVVGALAAEVLAASIIRGVQNAEAWGPYPSFRSLKR
jgi:L-aminopeptidase/D-esterase-like protein